MKTMFAALLLLCHSSTALTIIGEFTGGDLPTNIVGAGNTQESFRAAADEWELIYRDDHVLHVSYNWAPVGTPGVLGGPAATHTGLAWENGRETSGHISVDNDGSHSYSFYLDATPYANEEFGGYQIVTRDHGGGEIVFGHGWLQSFGEANGAVDLVTIFKHEIGHALGLSVSMPNWGEESSDGVIHIYAPLPYAGTEFLLARNCCEIQAHISGELGAGPIMTGVHGERRRPSYADILAIAQMSGWRKLNLDLRPVLRVLPHPALDSFPARSGELGGVDFPGARFEIRDGGAFISITNHPVPLDPTNSGTARFTFYAPATTEYVVRALVRAAGESSNSLWIDIDADPVAPSSTWHMEPTQGFQWRTASWQGAGSFTNSEFVPKIWLLQAGSHELRIVGREQGCEIMTLSIVRADGQPSQHLTLDWSAHCQGYRLESAPSVAGPWQMVNTETTFLRGRYVARVPVAQEQQLFRLSQEVAP